MTDAGRRDRSLALCLVTPGVRPGTTAGWPPAALIALVQRAIDAGVDLVQLREPQAPTRQLYEVASEAVRRSRNTTTRIIVNDRFDVALAAGADGVHLGHRSLPPARVRDSAPAGFLVGCSVHCLEELRDLRPPVVDYLIAGAVYPTGSKPADTRWLGVGGFASLAKATPLPVLAIGGVTLDRIAELAAAGAAGIAAIGLFADASENQVRAVADEARRALTPLDQLPKLRHTDDPASPRDKANR